ncbi:hypothetical protein [Embleya sp. NPDC005971]|uniref:hypothetical protein n=1 Tax=Embleya sp. NPDC005971 TaxID=3156724 RepID=UPI0033C17317
MTSTENTLADIQRLSQEVHDGGRKSFCACRDLFQKLLVITVMAEGQQVILRSGPKDAVRALEGAHRSAYAPTDTGLVRLRDNHWLSIGMHLSLTKKNRLAVGQSKFQYQWEEDRSSAVFRYDYSRASIHVHPAAHVNIHGSFDAAGPQPLERIHFPTGRTSLEQVLRLLIQGFKVPAATPSDVWLPALASAEARFAEVANQPPFVGIPDGA